MNWKNVFSKVLHAVVPAAGAALAAVVPALGLPVIAKVAIGAALGYIIKPARTPTP